MMASSQPAGPSLWQLVGQSVQLWVGTFLLLVGLVFLAIGVDQIWEEDAYRTQGLTVEAVLMDKSLVKAKRGENSRTRYVVTYRFMGAQGEEVEGSTDIPMEQWEQLEPGQTFAVTYLPSEPDSSRARSGNEWIAALVFVGIGGVFALLGGGLAFFDARNLVRAVHVLRQGLVTDSIVLRASPTSTSVNRVSQWRIHYRYHDHLGRPQEGASYLVSPEEGSAWKEGDRGTVRFDREHPEISLWIGRIA